MRFSTKLLSAIGVVASILVLPACGASTGRDAGVANNSSAPVIPQAFTVSPSERYLYLPAKSSATVPSGTPPIVNGWVSLSGAVTGVPCTNCAGNPPAPGSLGVAFPAPYLSHTGSYQITYTFYNVSEGNSACSLIFNLAEGTTTLFHHTFAINLNGNGHYVYFIQSTMPSTAQPGAAKSSAKLVCGGFTGPVAAQQDYLF